MKSCTGIFIGLLLSVSVSAESLLEGRVRLASGEPVAGVQVRLFDLADLRRSVGATTDEAGHFTLSLQAFVGRSALPQGFALGQNYPNPFNPSTVIPYQLPTTTHVRLEVFNLLGQRLATLVDGERPAGAHMTQWDGTDAAGRAVGAGVYIYRLIGGGHMVSRRMVLIDGQAGMSAAGAAGPIRATEVTQEREYGLVVSGRGLAPFIDRAFRVEAGMGPVELVVAAHPAGKALGDDDFSFDLSDLFDLFNTPAAAAPDLVVSSASASDTTLTAGRAFTLHAKVRNQGDEPAAATTLRYYRSIDATITSDDEEVGTDAIGALNPGAISGVLIALTAPAGAGTYYYGACVESVSGESESDNNCSEAVTITVSGTSAAEEDAAAAEEAQTDSTSSQSGPDLIVQSASASDTTLTPGQAFTLHAVVRNQGDGQAAATTLHYYRSNNSTISSSDTEVDTGEMGALDASATSADSIALTAPTDGRETYFYGACVASVRGESNTENNCSIAVRVTVADSGTGDDSGGGDSDGGDEGGGDSSDNTYEQAEENVPTNLTRNSRDDGSPAWSPDGTQIAFESNRDGYLNDEIYVMAADGSQPTRLTRNRDLDGSPAWSPDGTQIAFYSDRDGNFEIYVMAADGSQPTRLTRNSAWDWHPAWSPDGTQIAFQSNRDGNFEIYVMAADGSQPTRLTRNSAYDWHPAWSPDGTQIAFESNRDGNFEIYVMAADGSQPTRLTRNSAYDGSPAWSPDGTQIAFASNRDGNSEIYVMAADGSQPTRLTRNDASDWSPAWSPDGTQIAFESDRDGNDEIYVMAAKPETSGDGGDGGGGGSSDDHSNTRSGATDLPLGSSRSGEIETGSDVDYFRVQVGESGTLTVYSTGSLDTKGELQSSSGSRLASNDDGGSGSNFRIERSVSAGTYYVKVESYSSRTGSYTIHASFSSGGDGGGGGGGSSDDHSNTRSGATDLPLGSSRSGEIETGSDVDYFRVQVGESGTLTVYSTGSLDTKGELQSSSGSRLASNDDGGSGSNFRIERSVSAGTYYVKVESYSSRTGSYTIHASFSSGGDGGGGGGGDSGDAISLSFSSCSGSYLFGNSGSATVSITGTVRARRSVSSLTLTGYANGEWVGVDFIGSLSAGESENFSISGIIYTSGSSLNCRVESEGTVLNSAKVTAGDAESSQQVRVQGSLSPASAILNRKQPQTGE